MGKRLQQGCEWLHITLAIAGSLELIEGRMQEPRHPYEVEGLQMRAGEREVLDQAWGDKWEACWMWREGEWEAWDWDKPSQERNKTLRKTSGLKGNMSLFVGMWRVRYLWDVQMEMFSGQPNKLERVWGWGENLAGDSVGSHPCVGDGESCGCKWGHSGRWRGYGIGRADEWVLRIPWFKGEQRKILRRTSRRIYQLCWLVLQKRASKRMAEHCHHVTHQRGSHGLALKLSG